jgi:hypothetical protein
MATAIFVLAGVIALVLIIAAAGNKDLNIERSVRIERETPVVFDYIRHLKNHDNFSVWQMMDPNMKKTYSGTDGQVGFVYGWDSANMKNVGAGEQEIKKIDLNKSIDFELRFFRPMQDVAKARMETTANGSATEITWSFASKMKFPMNIMKPVMVKLLGKNLQDGVNNLKAVMEK